jgi:hypothetical protein
VAEKVCCISSWFLNSVYIRKSYGIFDFKHTKSPKVFFIPILDESKRCRLFLAWVMRKKEHIVDQWL